MMKKVIFTTFAELMVNLAGGWLIIASSAPFLPDSVPGEKIGLLLINLGVSIMCLIAAIWLRRKK